MTNIRTRTPRSRRGPRLIWLSLAAAVVVMAVTVEVTRTGLDLLVLLVIGLGVVTLERTVGDWLGELLGSGLATLVLGSFLGGSAWLAFESGGPADRFFAAAEKRGYRTTYYETSVVRVPATTSVPAVASTGFDPAPAARPSQSPRVATTHPPVPPKVVPPQAPAEPSPTNGSRRPTWLFQEQLAPSRLTLDVPTPSLTGEPIALRARLTSQGSPVRRASIAFTANGRFVASGVTGVDGNTSVTFSARVPGRYEIRAEFENDGKFVQAAAGATLILLQGKF